MNGTDWTRALKTAKVFSEPMDGMESSEGKEGRETANTGGLDSP